MMIRRDMTVGELRELLAEYPDHQPVVPVVNAEVGVMLGARLMSLEGESLLLLGEADLPLELQEAHQEWKRAQA